MTKRHPLLLLALPPLLLATMQGAIQPAAAETVPSPLPAGRRFTVTLLTGDVVTVVTRESGCPLLSVKPAKPDGVQLRSCGPDGHARVVPVEAAPLIGSVLDEDLFDVTTLIKEGYDDGRTSELPLIVKRAVGTQGIVLKSIDSVAVKQPKGGNFLKSLNRARLKSTIDGPLVRLDRRVRVTTTRRLDSNLEQVSAPEAWRSGVTGRGVKVAVLDTGVDITHPDLASQVAERADFVIDGGAAVDGHGHGTHVAATIAGSGKAARGQRKGVAPQAQLVIGKVLDDFGYGEESDVIAGMEWAAARAKVVNMSLGGFEPSDGTDPMSQAVDALTARHGTLFVVAAGNEPADGFISWPAAAASALTVGAVDSDDKVAWFSSRGPVINTRAAKPELVAPGVGIIAARAAGTAMGTLIDDNYTAASGTSMAAPHVAGAAALLAQRYPDWTAGQLKSALVGAADPLPGSDTYVVGSGRLNAARALKGTVSQQPIVNLGATGTQAELDWSGPVRLDVTATDRHRNPTPPGAVTLSGNKLTVDRTGLRPGFYSAVVTARSWRSVSTTPVTFYVEPPTVDLALTATPPPNSTPDGWAYGFGTIVNLDDPAIYAVNFFITPGGPGFTLRVPAGRYSITATVGQFSPDIVAMVGDPDIVIAADTELVLDGANAKPINATIEGADTVASSKGVTAVQAARRGQSWVTWAFAWGEDARRDSVLAGPVGGAGIGTFETFTSFSLMAPGDEPSPYLYDVTRANGNGIPDDLSYRFSRADQAEFIRIDQRFHLLDRDDETYVSHKRYGVSPSGVFVLENDTHNLPAHRIDYLSPGFGYKDEAFYNGGIGFGAVTQEAVHSYEPGSRHEKTWVRQPLRPDWYDDPRGSTSGCEPAPISRTRGNLHVELVPMTDQHQRFTCFPIGEGTLALHRNGKLVAERQGSAGDFSISASPARYRLTYDVDASTYMPVSTRVTTAWTFRSRDGETVPLLSIDYALPLDSANHPTDGRGAFTIRQAHGARWQYITSFVLWVSTDDGATWQPITVRRDGTDTFSADLPRPAVGAYVSLRIKAEGSAGSGLEQTIIRAYR